MCFFCDLFHEESHDLLPSHSSNQNIFLVISSIFLSLCQFFWNDPRMLVFHNYIFQPCLHSRWPPVLKLDILILLIFNMEMKEIIYNWIIASKKESFKQNVFSTEIHILQQLAWIVSLIKIGQKNPILCFIFNIFKVWINWNFLCVIELFIYILHFV